MNRASNQPCLGQPSEGGLGKPPQGQRLTFVGILCALDGVSYSFIYDPQ
jgi:hypothetical protein